jgi:hypothetical protein
MMDVTSSPLPMPAELIAPLLLELLVLIEVVAVIGVYLGRENENGTRGAKPRTSRDRQRRAELEAA